MIVRVEIAMDTDINRYLDEATKVMVESLKEDFDSETMLMRVRSANGQWFECNVRVSDGRILSSRGIDE